MKRRSFLKAAACLPAIAAVPGLAARQEFTGFEDIFIPAAKPAAVDGPWHFVCATIRGGKRFTLYEGDHYSKVAIDAVEDMWDRGEITDFSIGTTTRDNREAFL